LRPWQLTAEVVDPGIDAVVRGLGRHGQSHVEEVVEERREVGRPVGDDGRLGLQRRFGCR
jgi:hypothetical protein